MVIPRVQEITKRVVERSSASRAAYLAKIGKAHRPGVSRAHLSCGNLAHGFAASEAQDKNALAVDRAANFAIVSAYNDMLSAHQPFQDYPAQIKAAAREIGAIAQFAGGVPAMCDGVTQGREGMELSLFSRDTIAMATSIALSHDMFDGVLCLGVCDKIVPGLAIGALAFGHLPCLFVPAGPMESGLPNAEKGRIRQLFAEGRVGREELLEAERQSYHSAGTCTFYGTANSNQMLMEIMGMQLPGSSFVNPGTPLRAALTRAAVERLNELSPLSANFQPLGEMIDEKSIINGIVGLLATGGSTNHTIHLVAIARAAGVIIDWQDMADLSEVVPLLCRIYPNGLADVNHFHAAGGMARLIAELLDNGLVHEDVATVVGKGLSHYRHEPFLNENGRVEWRSGSDTSLDAEIIATCAKPFSKEGGLRLLRGNLGRSVIKTSAVQSEFRTVRAPAVIFDDQNDVKARFDAGDLDRDFIAVVRFQGPKANGMPELHKLTPILGVLQDRGYKVALVTDGRMSGASGKVPAAIHLTPEALDGGPIARLQDGDMVELDADAGLLRVVDEVALAREPAIYQGGHEQGMGRELFTGFRQLVSSAESGASVLGV